MADKDTTQEKTEEVSPSSRKSRRGIGKVLVFRVVPLILVAGVVGGSLLYLAHNKPEVLGLSSINQQQKETAALLQEVSKLMALPKDEAPTVATVSDIEKLKGQSFFKSAQNGDKMLIYASTKKAILYRPSEKRIIDVGFVNLNQSASASANTSNATSSPAVTSMRFALFNGTGTVGATKPTETALRTLYKDSVISERAVASKTDYTDSLLIDLGGNRGEDTKKIAEALKIAVGALPDGEKKPEGADFLIIVGAPKE